MIKRLSPCPIIEATIQINCTFMSDPDIVVGQIFTLLSEIDGIKATVEKFPLMNLPEDIRRNDPNLRDKAWYKLSVGEYYILIGLFGVALGINPPYKGWDGFKEFSARVFNRLKGTIITTVESVSLKYLDFFSEINIFEKIKCEISMNDKQIIEIPTIFRTELREGDFIKIIQITNGAHLVNQALNIDNDGSLLEMSLFTRAIQEDDFFNIIDKAHEILKSSFFQLLTEEYLHTFAIEYE